MLLRWIIGISFFALVLLSRSSSAYYSTADTGEILKPGHYDVGAEAEFITDHGSGANGVAKFDAPLSDETQARAMIGFGSTNFQLGGFFKWIPIPDLRSQPAIGLIGGAIFARTNNDLSQSKNYMTFRVAPIISKTFFAEQSEFTPYASLPVGMRIGDGKTVFPVQLAIGLDLKTHHLDNFRWRVEGGFDLTNKAYSYISLNAFLTFDEEHGIEFK